MYPTDVTNHYSGYPVTRWGQARVSNNSNIWVTGRCGAEVWTCYGHLGSQTVTCSGITFRSETFTS